MRRFVCLALSAATAATLSLHAPPAAAQAPVQLAAVGAAPAPQPGAGRLVPTHLVIARAEQPAARTPRWPWYAVGGAILGAGTVTVLVLANCDAGCRDDGGYGYAFGLFVPAAAAVGAVGGAIIGLVVDHTRRAAPE